jgi:1-(5-phosphoribosyl)-5-[(5-phosphoribosylamino)methylideneamino] imidazole-4-carboxamide isomerase/N-(5'phosphoribosyl)anthranilate isomerase
MSDNLILFPAIDVANGQAVRLSQGIIDTDAQYGSPVEAAQDFIDAGAKWIHLVDLDAAFSKGTNTKVIQEVISSVGTLNIQLSGGIRDAQSLQTALNTGATRVNLATSALLDLDRIAEVVALYGDRLAVGLDVRGTSLSARGENLEAGEVFEVLEILEQIGCSRYIVTDVMTDGMLLGPNVELLKKVLDNTDKPVIASGGISSLDDLKALRELVPLGLEGAILGKALYAGKFSLEQALEVASN